MYSRSALYIHSPILPSTHTPSYTIVRHHRLHSAPKRDNTRKHPPQLRYVALRGINSHCVYTTGWATGEVMDLLKELEARREKGRAAGRGAGRSAFLAHKTAIEKALGSGYTAREVYEGLQSAAGLWISYSQFARYVARYITKTQGKTATRAPAPTPAEPLKAAPDAPTFQHRAKPDDDDDLIGS